MIKKNLKNIIISAVAAAVLLPSVSDASVGISTRYGTIVLEQVQAGKVYNLTEMRDMPFLVINRGNKRREVHISVLPPQDPKKGYEPIPDPNWLRVRPDKFELESGENMPSSLILNIPEREEYIGKHYHALIRTETLGEGFFGAAVVNNFYFSVEAPGPEEVAKAKAEKILGELNYDLNPESLFLDIPAGKEVNILKELDKALQVINRGRQDLDLIVKSVSNKPGFPTREGYRFTPSTEYLSPSSKKVKIKSYRVKDINLIVQIPQEYQGQRMMFLVAVYPEDFETAKLYSRVYVNVK